MVRPHVLHYAQDPGGTRYLDPVIIGLIAEDAFDWSILLHPFAKDSMLMDDRFAAERTEFSDDIPASAAFFKDVLKEHKPDVVICTTSAQARDPSNCMLIDATKQLGIPSFAAMDHWKGLDRFFDGDKLRYFPDQLLCIDHTTRDALGTLGTDISKVHPVGHPGLERISHRTIPVREAPWRVLLVSQPIVQDGAYHGIYDERIDGDRLVDHIADALDHDDFEVYLRRHPKEYAGADLPLGVCADEIPDWNTARAKYDVFIGFDSMALIEASLSGAPCIRLALPEMADISDQPVPLDYGIPTTSLKDLAANIRMAVAQSATPSNNPFMGSTDRAAGTIRNFVNSIL